MEKLISKSNKRRQGHLYQWDGKVILDKNPRQWKQVVKVEDAGYKRSNGKQAMSSRTYHVPA